jgi:hypothetical protein
MARNNNSAIKEILSVAWNTNGNIVLYSEKGELLPKILNIEKNEFINVSMKGINYKGDIKICFMVRFLFLYLFF